MDFIDRAPLSLDRDRVICLLLINTYLMKKCLNMYTNVITNQQMMQQMNQEQKTSISYSYNHCIKRLQCNLTALNYIHEKYHSTNFNQNGHKQPIPAILSPPPDMPELNNLYLKLQELYAEEVQYFKQRYEALRKQQMYNSGNGGQEQMPNPMLAQQMSQQQIPQQPQSQPQQQHMPPHMQQQGLTPSNMTPQQTNINISQNIPPQSMSQMIQQQEQKPPPLQHQQSQQSQPQQLDDMFINDNYPSNDPMPSSAQGYQNYNMQGFNNGNNNNDNNNENNGINSLSMSTLSPQQILQQANESKSTPNMTHMDSGLF